VLIYGEIMLANCASINLNWRNTFDYHNTNLKKAYIVLFFIL